MSRMFLCCDVSAQFVLLNTMEIDFRLVLFIMISSFAHPCSNLSATPSDLFDTAVPRGHCKISSPSLFCSGLLILGKR